jgi:hypothetical protein
MDETARLYDSTRRCSFIGGSDARVIMGSDEAALVCLWRENRGEAKPPYLRGPDRCGFRRRTPGPPPFPSMNSTPAASKARRTAKSFGAVIEVSVSLSSARRMVATPTADSRARSSARHRRKARAARI